MNGDPLKEKRLKLYGFMKERNLTQKPFDEWEEKLMSDIELRREYHSMLRDGGLVKMDFPAFEAKFFTEKKNEVGSSEFSQPSLAKTLIPDVQGAEGDEEEEDIFKYFTGHRNFSPRKEIEIGSYNQTRTLAPKGEVVRTQVNGQPVYKPKTEHQRESLNRALAVKDLPLEDPVETPIQYFESTGRQKQASVLRERKEKGYEDSINLGETIDRTYNSIQEDLYEGIQVLRERLGQAKVESFQNVRQDLSELTQQAQEDPSILESPEYIEKIQQYEQFKQAPGFAEYEQMVMKFYEAQESKSNAINGLPEYVKYKDQLEESAKRRDLIDATNSGMGYWLERHLSLPVTREIMKFGSGMATLPFHLYNAAKKPGSYDWADYAVEQINRTVNPDLIEETMLPSRASRGIVERVADVDGYQVVVGRDGVEAVRDADGYIVRNQETIDKVLERYDSGEYEARTKFNKDSLLDLMVGGTAQVLLTSLPMRGLKSPGLAKASGIATQTARLANDFYLGAIDELGIENKDVATRYALGSALLTSSVNILVNPIEAQVARVNLNPSDIFRSEVGRLAKDLKRGMGKTAAYNSAMRRTAIGLGRKLSGVAKEGVEGLLEQGGDLLARAAANEFLDPTSQMDIDATFESFSSAFMEEALGGAILAGGPSGRINRLHQESMLRAYENRGILQDMPEEVKMHYGQVFRIADGVLDTDSDPETKMRKLASIHAETLLRTQGAADPSLEESHNELIEAERNIIEEEVSEPQQGEEVSLVEVEEARIKALDLKEGETFVTAGGQEYEVVGRNDTQIHLKNKAGNDAGFKMSIDEFNVGVNNYYDSLATQLGDDSQRKLAKEIANKKRMLNIEQPLQETVTEETVTEETPVEEEPGSGPASYDASTISQIDKDYEILNPKVKERLDKVKDVLNVLPDFKIVLHDTNESIEQYLGVMNPISGAVVADEIHLNLTSLGDTTAYHEAIHPIIASHAKSNPDVIDRFFNELKSDPNLFTPQVQEWMERYGDEPSGVQQEEAVVEFLAKVADGQIDVSKTGWERVRDFIRTHLLEPLGLVDEVDSEQGLKDFARGLAKNFQEGIAFDVEPTEVKEARASDAPVTKLYDPNVVAVREHINDWIDRMDKDQLVSTLARAYGMPTSRVETIYKVAESRPKSLFKLPDSITRSNVFRWIEDNVIFHLEDFHTKWLSYRKGLPKIVAELKEYMNGNILAEVEKGRNVAAQAMRQIKQDNIDIQDVDDFLRGRADSETIERLGASVPLLTDMRAHIDRLSSILIDEGYVYGETKEKIAENLGTYLSRQYRIFIDNDYKPTEEVYQGAVDLYYRNFIKLYDKKLSGQKSPAEIQDLARRRAINAVNDILTKPETAFKTQPREGSRDMGIMKRRKAYPEPMRVLVDKVAKGQTPTAEETAAFRDLAVKERLKTAPKKFSEKKALEWAEARADSDLTKVLDGFADKVPWAENLPKEIRRLLGEYENPLEAYMLTVYKLAHFTESSRFLRDLQVAGLNNFFWTKDDPERPESASYQLAGKGSEGLLPLVSIPNAELDPTEQKVNKEGDVLDLFVRRDLYTTREVYEALVKGLENSGTYLDRGMDFLFNSLIVGGREGRVANAFDFLNSYINWVKTVGSIGTHAKNFGSGGFFMMANGVTNLNPIKVLPNLNVSRIAMGLDTGILSKNKYGEYKMLKRNQERALYILDKLKRANVIGQNISLNVIREINDPSRTPAPFLDELNDKGLGKRLKRAGTQTIKGIGKFYGAEDDIWRVLLFLQEADQHAKALFKSTYDNLTEDQRNEVDLIAIDIVKNHYPNYGRLGQVAQQISRSPLIGDFIPFFIESFRTNYNILTRSMREMASDNQKIRAIGVNRLAGLATTAVIRGTVINITSQIGGGIFSLLFDDEDEREKQLALRKVVYPFMDQNDLIVGELSGGKVSVWDFSGIDPFNARRRIENILLSGQDQKLYKVGEEMLGTIFSPTISLELMDDLANNRDTYEREIAGSSRKGLDRLDQFRKYLFKAAAPGTISSAIKIAESDDPGMEVIAQATGIRRYDIDISNRFFGMMKRFKESARYDITNRMKDAVNNEDYTVSERRYMIEKIEEDRRRVLDEMRELYEACLTLGVSAKDLEATLDVYDAYDYKAGTVRELKKDVQYILGGKYEEMNPKRYEYRK